MRSWADKWRKDFPALTRGEGNPEAYLDSACMSLVPQPVLDAMTRYYSVNPGCGGRSVHRWATEVTEGIERTREEFGRFLHADPALLVNLRNTTEAINLVARGLSLKRGDTVLVTDQEHNSNLVVWQVLHQLAGIRLRVLSLPEDRPFDNEAFQRALDRKIRLVSFFHSSNMDGRTLPAREIIELAHDHGTEVLLDGSQAVPHSRVDLSRLGVDYYAISLHKMLGPTGTGLLYGARGKLEKLQPLVVGGETVAWSDYANHEPLPPPARFEAGLQNYAGILGAGAAVSYLSRVDFGEMAGHMETLQRIAARTLEGKGVRLLGLERPADRGAIFSIAMDGFSPHDTALFLEEGYGVMVRSGMNCVHSWYRARGLEGSVRASFYLYNTESEAKRFVDGIQELSEIAIRRSQFPVQKRKARRVQPRKTTGEHPRASSPPRHPAHG